MSVQGGFGRVAIFLTAMMLEHSELKHAILIDGDLFSGT